MSPHRLLPSSIKIQFVSRTSHELCSHPQTLSTIKKKRESVREGTKHAAFSPQVENANVFKISQHVKQLQWDCFQMILSPFLLKKRETSVSRTRRADCLACSLAPLARGEGQLQSNLTKRERIRKELLRCQP